MFAQVHSDGYCVLSNKNVQDTLSFWTERHHPSGQTMHPLVWKQSTVISTAVTIVNPLSHMKNPCSLVTKYTVQNMSSVDGLLECSCNNCQLLVKPFISLSLIPFGKLHCKFYHRWQYFWNWKAFSLLHVCLLLFLI